MTLFNVPALSVVVWNLNRPGSDDTLTAKVATGNCSNGWNASSYFAALRRIQERLFLRTRSNRPTLVIFPRLACFVFAGDRNRHAFWVSSTVIPP